MNRLGFIFRFCASVVLFSFLSSCTNSSVKQSRPVVLVVGTNATYPPYEYIDEQGKVIGFDIDIAYEIGKKLHRPIVIKEFGFDALILNVKKGKIDMAIAGMSITPERQREVAMIPYQGEVMKELAVVFWERVPESPLPLSQYGSIAVQVSTFQERFVEDMVVDCKGLKVKSFDSTVELIMEIKYGKSAIAVMEPSVARLMKIKFPALRLVMIPIPEDKWTMGNGIIVAKNNTDLIDKIQNAILEMKSEGIIDHLEKKWSLGIVA